MIDSSPTSSGWIRQPWTCEVCHKQITGVGDDYGFISIVDHRRLEGSDYDPDAPTDDVALGDRGEVLTFETVELQVRHAHEYLGDPGVSFHVYHSDCAPPGPQGYTITIDRAATIEQWAAWLSHLGQKNWIKKRDVIAAIRFWCGGHGLVIRDDLL